MELKKHDSILDQIGISTETGYFETDAKFYWEEVDIKADNIAPKIDLIVKRAHWKNEKISINWKIYTDEVDNDASIYLNEESFTIRYFFSSRFKRKRLKVSEEYDRIRSRK